jgi:hypothetical protein
VTTDVYWKDKFGSVIAYPDPIENGTYVQMFYVKSDLLAGQNVRFDITKGGSVIDSVTVVSTAGRAVARWDTNATTMGLTNSNKEVHLNFTVAGITGPGLNVTLNPGGTPPITVMTGCQYYNSSTPATTRETQCNSDNQGITPLNKRYEDGLWAPSGCDSLSSGEECRCAWKTTSGVSHCTLIKTDGVCEKIYSMEGSCVDGVQKYKVEMNYIGTGADPGECVGTIEDQEGPCGLALAELPFFGVIQIILAALVIFAIYLAITHRKS